LETAYGKRTCFLALSLLYDTTTWGLTNYHIDHIIPRSLTDRNALMAASVPEVLIQRIQDSVNRLGNLQLLRGQENLKKNDQPFAQWIKTRDQGFLDRHLIPGREDLYNVSELPNFVAARDRLIIRYLQRTIFGTQSLPSALAEGVEARALQTPPRVDTPGPSAPHQSAFRRCRHQVASRGLEFHSARSAKPLPATGKTAFRSKPWGSSWNGSKPGLSRPPISHQAVDFYHQNNSSFSPKPKKRSAQLLHHHAHAARGSRPQRQPRLNPVRAGL
jgi:Protein of unknown function (DUF1524)